MLAPGKFFGSLKFSHFEIATCMGSVSDAVSAILQHILQIEETETVVMSSRHVTILKNCKT